MSEKICRTSWDANTFSIDTYKIIYESDKQLRATVEQLKREKKRGHYTIKIDPLASKKALHELKFYYCDTLIEPYCTLDTFIPWTHEGISISLDTEFSSFTNIVQNSFSHGRFHRDFMLDRNLANTRYARWLEGLCESEQVFGLIYFDEVAGFFGFSSNSILLHALSERFRGKGLAKYFWSYACQALFEQGYPELKSSISAANMAVLNLYASLGFKFRKPTDVYHYSFLD